MKRYLIVLCAVFFSVSGLAQTVQLHRTFNFKVGDEYQKQTLINSSCLIQRGTKKLEINTSTNIRKDYCVSNSSSEMTSISASIQDMEVVVKVKGDELHFHSGEKNDSTSKIDKALQFMVDKPDDIILDKYGKILYVNNPSLELVNDTLLRFAGIEPEPLYKGRLLSFLADFVDMEKLHKGYSWVDSTHYAEQTLVTRFTIDDWTVKATTINYKSAVTGESINSNTNGTFVVDNETGLIIQNLMQTVSIGYQVAHGVIYATTRRITLNEVCAKLEPGMPDK